MVVRRRLFLFALTAGACAPSAPAPAPAPGPAPAPAPGPIAYWSHVAPILESHCTSCHAPGGIGPISLTRFEDAKTHAGAIAYQTRERDMPPWLPNDRACAPLKHARSLSEAEITTLEAWASSGAPEGSRDAYRAPARNASYGALGGEPDRVVTPREPYTLPKKARTDDYRCFVIDPKLERPERVVGLRIAPGLASVVHHVLLFEVRASAVDKVLALDARDPGPGYGCFGGIGVAPTVRAGNLAKGELVDFDAQMIVGWAPGAGATDVAGAPTALPEGTAISLAAGSKLVMQVHYNLDNASVGSTDETRIDMWLAKSDAQLKQAVWLPLAKYGFSVPAGVGPDDPRATARADVPFPLPLEVLGVAPHMHLRGQSIRVDLGESTAPASNANASSCLLDVPRWDFKHQEGYWLARGVRASSASVTCRWDNRASNQPVVRGARKAPRDLHWGEGTDDEMCLAFLYATL